MLIINYLIIISSNETFIIESLNNPVAKTMNRACELTEGKILLNIDSANEGSPVQLVDGMREAGNKKTPL